MNKKVWIFAGERSGDMYGARLASELKKSIPSLTIQGMGGREMRNSGVEILVDSTELGVVGILEVFKNLNTFLCIFKDLVNRARQEKPDLIILIDYPGFNLRFAKKMKRLGIKVFYYISPQVWAWKSSRIRLIAKNVAKMMVIFPFEKEIYQEVGLETHYVGHPLLDIMKAKMDSSIQRRNNLILLLPGSRYSEVDRLLRPMIQTACLLHKQNSSLEFAIAVPHLEIQTYVDKTLGELKEFKRNSLPVKVVCGQTEELMQRAVVGLAASGTVTVQCAIFSLPIVVIYKVNPFTYLLGRILVKVPYITMVNIIANSVVFEEFIQGEVDPSKLVEAINRILPEGRRRESVLKGMKDVLKGLSSIGDASQKAAEITLCGLSNQA